MKDSQNNKKEKLSFQDKLRIADQITTLLLKASVSIAIIPLMLYLLATLIYYLMLVL